MSGSLKLSGVPTQPGLTSSNESTAPAVPPRSEIEPLGKHIIVFCDGTGQDGLIASLSKEEVVELPSTKSIHPSTYPTNVLRLSRCIPLFTNTEPKRLQLVYYQSGVGAGDDFQGMSDLGDDYERARGTATGGKIRDAYNFIAQNYMEGDKIFLFGFSRGAYTARKVAGLICKLGLLDRWEMGKFFHYWSALDRNDSSFHYEPARRPSVEFVGTWDTVGSVYEELSPKVNALTLLDTDLPKEVKTARHALAYHENRKEFLPTPYVGFGKDRDVQQVWFPGAHSDVGGGYNEHLIADITLCWMAATAKSGLTVDERFMESCFVQDPISELRLHFERRNGVPFLTVNRMNVLVKTNSTHEVTLSNVEPQFLYHQSMWAEVYERSGGPSLKAFSGKTGEPDKKSLTPFEEKYWSKFGWNRLFARAAQRVPTPRGGPITISSPSRTVARVIVQHPVEFEHFSDYIHGVESSSTQ
ncbi:hypothetical protein BDV93DRAFT_563230 [Ceratobasidium sp. AG-I]|nr:hypothetical protein BDV93DRAFT_563230 [Ceratobasidium sp. AG-I]